MNTWTVMQMMWLWMVPLAVFVWLLTAASNRRVPSGCGPAYQPVTNDPAMRVVRERYARGEIGRTEYERLVAGLLGRS